MRYAKKIIIAGAAGILVGTSALATASAPLKPMVHIGSTIAELMATLDSARLDGTKNGCLTANGATAPACAVTTQGLQRLHDETGRRINELQARPVAARLGAIAKIRDFAGKPDLTLRYKNTVSNPYRDDRSFIETYADDRDYEFWINPETDLVVQMGPVSNRDSKASAARSRERLPVPELRRLANDVMLKHVPGFAGRRASLHPLEDNKKGEVYFFRWDDFSLPAKESEMPPFVQVGLYADGTIASYTNTLTR